MSEISLFNGISEIQYLYKEFIVNIYILNLPRFVHVVSGIPCAGAAQLLMEKT